MKKLVITCAAAMLATLSVRAVDTNALAAAEAPRSVVATPDVPRTYPFGLGLCSARPDADSICGLRLNLLVGRHANVSFVDLGLLANLVDAETAGVQIAGLYNHIGYAPGLCQVAGIYNRVDSNVYGLQVAALLNRVDGTLGGMNLAVINTAKAVTGLQLGVVNSAKSLSGMQIGLVNFASDSAEGIQIGLVNIMQDGPYPVCPIINVGF